MKRTLTPEQIARRDERRAKMRGLASQISKMTEARRAELAASCPVVTIEGRALSVFNQCFLAMQLPSATVVGGFRQWLKAGRAVIKGQHGATIWVPLGSKRTDQNGETIIDTDPDETRFILATVFDVSQTQEIETAVAA